MADDPILAAVQLDRIIDSMWEEGWNPAEGDINLFATDFGLALLTTLLTCRQWTLVLRSETDLSHLSLWDRRRRTEYFVFHKILKQLLNQGGESILSLVRQVTSSSVDPK